MTPTRESGCFFVASVIALYLLSTWTTDYRVENFNMPKQKKRDTHLRTSLLSVFYTNMACCL